MKVEYRIYFSYENRYAVTRVELYEDGSNSEYLDNDFESLEKALDYVKNQYGSSDIPYYGLRIV